MLKKINSLPIFISIMLFFSSVQLISAYEPPNISVEEGLKKGKVAFIGRVIKTEEIERQRYQIIAEATIQLLKCYYGIICEKYENVKLRYISNTIVDRSFSVEFSVSSEVLIILNNPINSNKLKFDSSLDGEIDLAYIIGDTFPENYQKNEILSFFSIYRSNFIYRANEKDILRWIKNKSP